MSRKEQAGKWTSDLTEADMLADDTEISRDFLLPHVSMGIFVFWFQKRLDNGGFSMELVHVDAGEFSHFSRFEKRPCVIWVHALQLRTDQVYVNVAGSYCGKEQVDAFAKWLTDQFDDVEWLSEPPKKAVGAILRLKDLPSYEGESSESLKAKGITWDDVFDWWYRGGITLHHTKQKLAGALGVSPQTVSTQHGLYATQYGYNRKPDNESRYA